MNRQSTLRVISLLGVLLQASNVFAQQGSLAVGLEVEDYRALPLVIERMPKEAERIGLTAERIRTRVEYRLRQAKLKPGTRLDAANLAAYLYVNVAISGTGFSVRLEFDRVVSYSVGNVARRCIAATWQNGGVGTHGGDAEYVLRVLDKYLDTFLNTYLKVNGQ